MRYIFAILLALALFPAHAQTLYALEWYSDLPIDPATIQATVTGGALVSTITTSDATQGWIEAAAPAACLTIRMDARTKNGIPVTIVRSWDAECQRVYVPMVQR